MNCRGAETRRKIVEEYDVKPVAHIKLLAGQSKHSDAEATIKDEYYIFSATRKRGRKDEKKEIIQCGMVAARDFLNILGIPGLPIFNPIKENSVNKTKITSKGNNSRPERVDDWDETAKQLYNAIMWLIIAWDAQPDTPLFEFRDEVVKYKKLNPFDSKIKRVNTVIANGGKGKTLTEIVDGFRTSNKIKDDICDFSLLNERMTKITDKDGNKIKSFF